MKQKPIRKSDLSKRLQEDTGIQPKHAKDLIDRVFDYVSESLIQGQEVMIQDFGGFRLLSRKARHAINTFTKAEYHVPAKTVVRFRPAYELREAVRNIRSDADKSGSVLSGPGPDPS